MNILQNIFKDYYEIIQYTLHPRDVVMENISKLICCGDPSLGGAMYACTHCGNIKFVPFRCKSRFCPTCGIKYCQQRSSQISFKLIHCTHRHCVFTIDQELRQFFLEDRSLLDYLFQAVRSVIMRMFHNINQSKNFVPGFVCVLHTFGRPLEWNPHIHCLITEGAFSDDAFWRVVKHFHYSFLRKSFQTALLNLMEQRIGPSFQKVKALIYQKNKNGFYVYAKPNLCSTDTVINYIGRYLGRPAIALKRIDSYDGETVTLHYNRHEDNAYVQRSLPAIEFIKLLIQHIPEKHFKMTRYYGLYARHREQDQSLHKAVDRSKHLLLKSFTKWRENILLSFRYDPLCCPNCKHEMELMELYHNHRRVSLEALYERAMAKASAVLLDFFSCLTHTCLINDRQEDTYGCKIFRGTAAKLYAESTGRNGQKACQRYV